MDLSRFSRSEMLIGGESVEKLSRCHVAVFGLGGVGSYTAEALARAGVGELTVIDNDKVAITNINRQLYALSSTVGMKKTQVAAARIKDINPDCKVNIIDGSISKRILRISSRTAMTIWLTRSIPFRQSCR